MVMYEAAAAIVSMKTISVKELRSAINLLQTFLSSPKSVSRYAAVRILNKVGSCFLCLSVAASLNIKLFRFQSIIQQKCRHVTLILRR